MPFPDATYPYDQRLAKHAPDLLDSLKMCLKVVDAYRRISGGDGDLSAALARSSIRLAERESE